MTHYDVLGIPQDASPEEIKTAYRNLIKAFHPDYYRGDKAFANRKTNEVTVAYQVLRDPNKRMEYDMKLLQERHRMYYRSEPQNSTPQPPPPPKRETPPPPPPPKKESPPPPPPKAEHRKPERKTAESNNVWWKSRTGKVFLAVTGITLACILYYASPNAQVSSQERTGELAPTDSLSTEEAGILTIPSNLTVKTVEGKSNISAYAYDMAKNRLYVWYTGGNLTCYLGVSTEEYYGLLLSEYPGRYISENIHQNHSKIHDRPRTNEQPPISEPEEWKPMGPSSATPPPTAKPTTKAEEWKPAGPSSTTAKPTTKPTAKPTATPKAVNAYSGMSVVRPDFVGVCPLEIKADASNDYYIYLEYVRKPSYTTVSRSLRNDAYTPYETDFSFYVEAGDTVEVDVPIGVYKLYYATGDTYYGKELLFGANTQYYSSDELLEFYASSQYYEGVTLTLYSVYNGNYDTDPINASEFPS